MHTAITLICNPARPSLDEAIVARASETARAFGLMGGRTTWLCEDVAAEIAFEGAVDAGILAGAVRAALEDAPIDVVVQPLAGRRKRLLVADMDSTVIEQECIDEIADYAGKRAEIAAITGRAMRGELDFEAALIERVGMLKGMPAAVLDEVFIRRITLTPGAEILVRTMNKYGATTALVSGGFTFFTERVAAAAGFDLQEANVLDVESGVLSGAVDRPIRGRAAKEEALIRIAAEKAVSLGETMAVGDGANDLAMLKRAGIGVAFRAKPAVAAAAHARIDHGDLTALLFLQGFAQSQFQK